MTDTTDQLTIPTAADRPLVVELTTLKVEGRRLTRTLYNQLREEQLIAEDGTLNGIPWGYVNEHSKKRDCGFFRGFDTTGEYNGRAFDRGHRHVIWQRGDELMRDVVLSLDAAGRRFEWYGDQRVRVWEQMPHTVPAARRSHNLIAGLPQIFIGR